MLFPDDPDEANAKFSHFNSLSCVNFDRCVVQRSALGAVRKY